MKKLLALLLALVVVGGFVFAEDAKPVAAVTGYFNAGTVLYDQDGKQSLGPSWVSSGHYANLGVSYKAAKYGFSATIEYENAAVNTAFRDYTLWVKPYDFMKVSAGKLRNGDYRLTSYVDASGFNTRLANAEYGLMMQFYPIKDLSIGAFLPVAAAGQNAADAKPGFGVAYTLPKIAKFIVAYKTDIDELFIGADIKAIEGLTAKLGFTMDTTAGSEFQRIWATAGYGLMDGALDLGLDAYYKMATAANTLWVKGKAGYTVDIFTPSAYVSFKNVSSPAANTIGFGAELKVAAGDGALYLGVDVESASSVTWSIPLTVEVSF